MGAKDTAFGATHVPSPIVALHREHGILAVAQECSLALIDLPALPADPP